LRIEIFCQRCGESISIDDEGKGTVYCPRCFYEFNVPATAAHIPRLCTLLEDDAWPVREAAASWMSDLGAVDALPQLLRAYERGIEDGHDITPVCLQERPCRHASWRSKGRFPSYFCFGILLLLASFELGGWVRSRWLGIVTTIVAGLGAIAALFVLAPYIVR
jgi:hypothetical protein